MEREGIARGRGRGIYSVNSYICYRICIFLCEYKFKKHSIFYILMYSINIFYKIQSIMVI